MNDKELEWVGSSKKDLKKFPDEIKRFMGHALRVAQQGNKHAAAKVLKGFGSAHLLEIIDMDETGTYRTAYTVKFEDTVYVLHAFQKKSKHGIATPKPEMDTIKDRLKMAYELSIQRKGKNNEK